MSVEIGILGLLREKNYHGYELKKEIQHRMSHWTDVKFGSIYHALRKLVDRGAVEKAAEERQSGRPERTIYRITKSGEEEFLVLLRDLLNRFQRVYLEFNIGFYFAGSVPTKELDDILSRRIDYHHELVEKLENHKNMPYFQEIPGVTEVILENSIFHLKAEEEWLKFARKRINKEDLYSIKGKKRL
ncbi:hypothetical protein CEE37_03585 [candidate division LCP-89 bacterium B3_LCP]|uniref:Transcription regulator PadR N-terminal domain-containing protein n=1 Tax=candidate division LCP-89 bacterium B3_LCP TaxID=2012998 RepID=A0A532V375_UNCL8|nr:MAG: hypothetical protein CEE37_03585 [candidate division LCP-89 bacterium B3_LCP]